MNSSERELFWQTLNSLQGEDVKVESRKLFETIKYPKYLFRYRAVTTNSLESLRTNKLYFSSANYYDDPFDTFLHIDIEKIRNIFLSAFQTTETTQAVVDGVKTIFGDLISPEQKELLTVENVTDALSKGLVDSFLKNMLLLRDEVKKDIWSVCFSENCRNETLWLKYAAQHKGFVLIYDLENKDNFLCGKQAKCDNCKMKSAMTPIYPVYYSDIAYDATDFAEYIMVNKVKQTPGVSAENKLLDSFKLKLWEHEKITLVKKECHRYDEEWRMVICQESTKPMIEWIPDGVILGLRMDISEENLVISLAKEAGIKKIYKSFINAQNRLDIIQIPLV